jgi:hypothetical protein
LAAADADLADWLGDDAILNGTAEQQYRASALSDTRRYPRGYRFKPGKFAGGSGAAAASAVRSSAAAGGGAGGAPATAAQRLLGAAPEGEQLVLEEQARKLSQHMLHRIQTSLAEAHREELLAAYKANYGGIGKDKSQSNTAASTPGTTTTAAAAAAAGTTTPQTPRGGSAALGGVRMAGRQPYQVEVEALGLAGLQRRVREAAYNRTRKHDLKTKRTGFRATSGAGAGGVGASYDGKGLRSSCDASTGAAGAAGGAGSGGGGDGTGGAPRWGARRNYQDLMEAQTTANILLQEHQYAWPHLQARQVICSFVSVLPVA